MVILWYVWKGRCRAEFIVPEFWVCELPLGLRLCTEKCGPVSAVIELPKLLVWIYFSKYKALWCVVRSMKKGGHSTSCSWCTQNCCCKFTGVISVAYFSAVVQYPVVPLPPPYLFIYFFLRPESLRNLANSDGEFFTQARSSQGLACVWFNLCWTSCSFYWSEFFNNNKQKGPAEFWKRCKAWMKILFQLHEYKLGTVPPKV